MSDNQLILLGLTLGLCIACFGVAIWAIIIAMGAFIELKAFKRSTHTIQYVDPATQGEDVNEKLAEMEQQFYEGEPYVKGPGGQVI